MPTNYYHTSCSSIKISFYGIQQWEKGSSMILCVSVSSTFKIIVQDEKVSKEQTLKGRGDVCQPISLKRHFLIKDGNSRSHGPAWEREV
jgi:hypothetical protein